MYITALHIVFKFMNLISNLVSIYCIETTPLIVSSELLIMAKYTFHENFENFRSRIAITEQI